jgi:hypothetical protein
VTETLRKRIPTFLAEIEMKHGAASEQKLLHVVYREVLICLHEWFEGNSYLVKAHVCVHDLVPPPWRVDLIII